MAGASPAGGAASGGTDAARDGGLPRALFRKLMWRTVPIACTATFLTFIDRASISLAAPVLLHDLQLSRREYGIASAAMFVTYGVFMMPSALLFSRLGVGRWMGCIIVAWGVTTAATAAAKSAGGLYAARLALGAAEAGTMPGCWFLLSRFIPARSLAWAYAFPLTLTTLAQVIGGPLGAAFLGPMDGVGGLRGWQWLFIVEGAATALIGAAMPAWAADTVARARWLTEDEKKEASAALLADAIAARAPPPDVGASTHPDTLKDAASAFAASLRVWQLAWLGGAVMVVQVAFFGVLFFTPIELASAFGGAPPVYEGPQAEAHKAMLVALKSSIVFAPSAAAMLAAGAWTRRTGDRAASSAAYLSASAAAFAALGSVGAKKPRLGLALLTLGSAGGCAALAPLTTWPHAYLPRGAPQALSYASWNQWVAVAGAAGPFLMGALPWATAFYVLAGCQATAAAMLAAFGAWEWRSRRASGKKAAAAGNL